MKPRIGLYILAVVSCMREAPPVQDVTINISAPGILMRSSDPDETLITDYNLYIYNGLGYLEAKKYVPAREMASGGTTFTARLLKDAPYTILAAANLGYELHFSSVQEAMDYRYHMAYPDEFSRGMPMAACLEGAVAGNDLTIDVPLERLMSRVDLCVDRRSLNEDVSIRIKTVQLCNTASSVFLFDSSSIENWTELFTEGYSKSGSQIYWLNHDTDSGTSGIVSFYLLENRSVGIAQSYIEIKADYHSSNCHSKPGESIVYRFFLNDEHDACRNTRYSITFRPEGTGLECTDGWQLDKSAMECS